MNHAETRKPDGRPEQIVPIVFASNDRYVPYAGVAIESIKQHMSLQTDYRIYVMHSGLSARHIRALEGLGSGRLVVRCLDISALLQNLKTELPVYGHFTEECYYRFLLPEIFSAYPKVVYLDCDLIVRCDIADIIPDNMGEALVAGVLDYSCAKDILRLERCFHLPAEGYINSGVLVFQIQKWNQEGTAEKCFEMVRTTPAEYLRCADQDILNAVCRGRILYLDGTWNFAWGVLFGIPEDLERYRPSIEKYRESFRILHYTTQKKPWNFPRLPYARYFWEIARSSPFHLEVLARCCADWLPLKLRFVSRSLREHGLSYTLRRALYYMRLRQDEEKRQ